MPIDFSSLNTGFEDYTGGMEEDVAPEPSSVIDYSDPRSILTSKNWINASSRQRLASAPVAFEKFTQALEEDKSRTIRGLNAKGEEIDERLFDPSGNYTTDGREYLERAKTAFDVAAQMEDGGAGYDDYNKSFSVNDTIGGILTKKREKQPDRFSDMGAYIQEKQKISKEGEAPSLTYKEYTDFANAEVKNGEAHLDPDNKEMAKAFYAESQKRTFDPSSLGDDVMIGKVGDQFVMNPKNFNQIDKMEAAINGLDLSAADKKMMLIDYRSKVEENIGKTVNQFAAADAGVLGSIVSSPLRDEFMEAISKPGASGYEFLKANKDRMDKDSYGVGSEIAATFRDSMMATGTGALWLVSAGNYTSPAEAWGGLAEDTAGAYSNGKAFELFGVDINRRDLTELTGQIGSFVAMGGMGSLAGKGLTKVGAKGAATAAAAGTEIGALAKFAASNSRYATNAEGVLLSTVAKTEAAAGTRTLGQKTLAGLKAIGTDPEVWLGSLQASGTSFGKTFNQEMNLHGDREKALKAANIEATSDGLSAFIATSVMNRVAPGMGKAFGMGDGAVGGGFIQNLKNKALTRESMEAVQKSIADLGGDAGASLRTQFAKDLKGVMNTSARQLGLKGVGVLGNMGAEAVEESADEIISDVISSMLDDSKTWTEDVWGNIGTKWKEYVKAGVLGAIGGAMGDASGTVLSPKQTFGKSEGYDIQKAAWDQLKTKVETFQSLDQYEFKGNAAGAKNMAEYIAMPDDKVSVEQKSKALLALARGQSISADFVGVVTPTTAPATSVAPTPAVAAATPPAAQDEAAKGHQEGTLGHFMEQTNASAPEGKVWKQDVLMTPSNKPMSFKNGATGNSYVVTPLNLDATEENGSLTANVGSKIVTTKRDGTTTVEYASAADTASFLKKQSRPQKEINGFEARANSETEYDEWTEEQSPASNGTRSKEPTSDEENNGAARSAERGSDSQTPSGGAPLSTPVAGPVASGEGLSGDKIDLSPSEVGPAKDPAAAESAPPSTENQSPATQQPTETNDEIKRKADDQREADAKAERQRLLNEGAAEESTPAAPATPKATRKIANFITNTNPQIKIGKVEGKPSEVEFKKDAEGNDTGVAVKSNGEVWITEELLTSIAEENGNDKAKTVAAVNALVNASGAVKLDSLPIKSVPDVQERTVQDVTYVVSMKTLDAGEKDSVGGQWTRTASEGRKKSSKPKTAEQLADEAADATLGTTDNGDYFYTPPSNSGVSLNVGDVVLIENVENEVLILDRVENGQWVFRRVNIAGNVTNVMTSRQKSRVFLWNVNRLLSGSKIVKAQLGAIKSGDITDAAMKSIFMEMVELVAPNYKGKIVETVFGADNARYLSADINNGTILVDYKNLKREFKALLKHANLSNDVTNEALATDVARIMGKMVDEEVIHILAAKELGKAESNKLYREVWKMGDKSPMFKMLVETAKERYPNLNPDPTNDTDDNIFDEENAAFSVIAEVIRKMHQLSTTGSTTEGAIDDSYILQAAIIRDLGKDAGVAPGKVTKFVNMVREMVRRYSNRVKNILWMRWQQGRLPYDQQNILARLNKAYRDQKIQGDFDYAQEAAEQRVKEMNREAEDSYTRWVNDIAREHYEAINELKALPNKFPNLKLDQVLMADNDTMALRIEPTIRALIEKHNLLDLGAVDEALAFLNTETKDENGDEIYAMSSYRQAMTVAFTKKQVMEAKLAKLDPELVDLVTGMMVRGEGDIDMVQGKEGQQGNYIGRVLRLVKDATTTDDYNPAEQLLSAEHNRLIHEAEVIRQKVSFIKDAITSREMQDVESIDVSTFSGRIKLMRVLAEDYPGMEVDAIDENVRPDEMVRMFKSVKIQLLRKIKLKALQSTHLIPVDGVGRKVGDFDSKSVKEEWNNLSNLREALGENLSQQKEVAAEFAKVSKAAIDAPIKPVPVSIQSTEYGKLIGYIRSVDDYNTYFKNIINRSLGDFFFNKGGFGVTFADLTRTEGTGAAMSFPEYQDNLPTATTASEVFGVEFKQKGTMISFHDKRPFALDGEELSEEQIDERDQIELLIQKAKSNAAFVGRQHFNRVYMDWMLGNFAKNEDYDLYLDTGGFNLNRTEDENDSDRYRIESPESAFKSLNLKAFKDLRRGLSQGKGAKNYSEKPILDFINEIKALKAWAEKIQNTVGGGMVSTIAGRQTLAARVKLAINDQFSPKGDNLRVLNDSDGSVSDKGVIKGKTSMEIDGLVPLLTKFESQLMSTLSDYLVVTESNGVVESTKLKKDVKPADLYAKLALVVYGDNGTGVSARLESANETVQQVRAALKEFKDKNWRRNYEREGSTIQRSDSFQPDNIELLELRDSPKDTRIYSNFLWLTSYHEKTRDYFVSGNFAFEMMQEHATVSYGEGRLPELYTNKKWQKVYLSKEAIAILEKEGSHPNVPSYSKIEYDATGDPSTWNTPQGNVFYMKAMAVANTTGSATNPNSFDADPRSRNSYDDIVGMLQEGSSLTQADSMLNRAVSGDNGRRYWITKWGMAIGANSEGEFSGKAASTFLDDLLRADRDGISRDDRMDLIQRGLTGLFPKAMGFSEESKRKFFNGIYEKFTEQNPDLVGGGRSDAEQFLVRLGEFKAGFERELLSQAKAGTSLGEAIRAVTLALPTEEMVNVEEEVDVEKDMPNPAYTPDIALGSAEDSFFAPTPKNKEPKTIKGKVKEKRIKQVPKSKLQHNSFSSPEETTAIKSFLERLVTSDNAPVYNASLMVGGVDGVGNSFVSMLVQSLPGKTLVVNPTEQQVARNGLAGISLKVFIGTGNAPNVIYAPQGQTSPELSSGVAHGAIAQLLTIASKNELARAEIDRLGRAIEETLDPVFMIEGLYNELSNGRARWTSRSIQEKLFNPEQSKGLRNGTNVDNVFDQFSRAQGERKEGADSVLRGATSSSMAYKAIEPRLSHLTAAEKKRFKKDLTAHIIKLSEYSSSLGIVKKNGASISLFPKRTALLTQKKGESEEKIDFDERGTTSRIMLIAELMSNPSAKRYFDKAYVGADMIGNTLLPRNVEEGLADALRGITRLDNERELFDSERVDEASTNSNDLAGREDDNNDDEVEDDSNETREDNPAIEEMKRKLESGEITAEEEESMREAMLGGEAKADVGEAYRKESFGPNADAVNKRMREMLDIRQAEDAKAEELGLRQDPSNILLFNGLARVLEFGKLATGESYEGEPEVRSVDNILNHPNTTNDNTKAMVGPLWKQFGDKRPSQIYVGEMRNLTLPKANGQTAHNIGFSKTRLSRAQAAIILGTRAARSVIDPIAAEQIAKTLRTSPFTRSFPRIEARIQVTDQLVSDLDAMLPDLGIKQIEQELRDSLEALDNREAAFRIEEVKALEVLSEIKAEVGRLPKERRNQKVKELQEAIKARKDQIELSSKRDKLRKTEVINGIEVPVHGGVLHPDAVKGIEKLIAKMEQEIASIDDVPAITLDQDDYDNISLRQQTRDLVVEDVLSGGALGSSEDTNAFVRSISNYYDKNPEMDLEKYVEERIGRSLSQGIDGEFKSSLDKIALSTEAALNLIENRTMTDGQLEAVKQAEKVLLRARNGIKQTRKELAAIENNEGQTYVGQGYFQGKFGSPAVAPRPGRSDGFAGVNPDTRSIGTNVFLAAPEMNVQRDANDTDESFQAKLDEWSKGWEDVVPADGLALTPEEVAENTRRRLARREHYIRAGSVSKALADVVEDYVDDAYKMARGTDENFNEFDPLKVLQESVDFAKAEQAAASRFFENARESAMDANNAGLHAEAIALLTNPKDANAMDVLTATQKGKVKMLRMPDNHADRVEKVGRLFEMDGEMVVLLPQTAKERLMRAYPGKITKRNVDSSLSGIILDAASIGESARRNQAETERFNELTSSIPVNPTQADLDAWKGENPAEYAELKAMRERVLRVEGYNRKGVRFGFYIDGVPLPPSIADQNFGPGYYVAEDAMLNATSGGDVSVSSKPNKKSLEELGLKEEDVKFRIDEVFVKAHKPIPNSENLTKEEIAFIEATIAYESAVNDAYIGIAGKAPLPGMDKYLNKDQLASMRGDALAASIRVKSESFYKVLMARAMMIRDGRLPYDSVRGIGGRTLHDKTMSSELVVQRASQIKTTEPLNLDKNGRLIPPSQWGDSNSSVIFDAPSISQRGQSAPSAKDASYFLKGADQKRSETFNGDGFSLTKSKPDTTKGQAATLFKARWLESMQKFLDDRAEPRQRQSKKVDLSGDVSQSAIADAGFMLELLVIAHEDPNLSDDTRLEIFKLLESIDERAIEAPSEGILGTDFIGINGQRILATFSKAFAEIEAAAIQKTIIAGMSLTGKGKELQLSTLQLLHHQDARIRNNTMRDHAARAANKRLIAFLDYGISIETGRRGYVISKKKASDRIGYAAEKVGNNSLNHTVGYLLAVVRGMNNANGMNKVQAIRGLVRVMGKGFEDLAQFTAAQELFYKNDVTKYWNGHSLDLGRDNELAAKIQAILNKGGIRQMVKDLKSDDEAGANEAQERLIQLLQNAVEDGKAAEVEHYAQEVHAVMTDIHNAMLFTTAVLSQDAATDVNDKNRQGWRDDERRATRPTYSSVPLRLSYAAHPDPTEMGQAGMGRYVSDPADIVSFKDASFFGGIGRNEVMGVEKNVFRPIALNGLSSPLSLVDDALYRLNVTPTYEVLRRSFGKTTTNHNIPTVEDGLFLEKVRSIAPDDIESNTYLQDQAAHEREVLDFQKAMAGITSELEIQIQNDAAISVDNTGGAEALRFLGSAFIVRALASPLQLWDQTMSPSVGYTAGKLVVGKPQMAKTYFKIIGKLLASLATDRKFWRKVRKFIEDTEPAVFFRASDGQDVSRDMLGNQVRYGSKKAKNLFGKAIRKYEQFGEKALDLTIGSGERVIASSLFLTELMNELRSNDLNAVLEMKGKQIPMMAKNNARVKVNDLMSQSDQSKKASIHHTKTSNPNLNAAFKSLTRFSNHTSGIASNVSVLSMPAIDPLLGKFDSHKWGHVDKENQQEALENVVQSLFQNILFYPMKLKVMVPLILSIVLNSWGDDDDDEAIRKAQDITNDLMAPTDDGTWYANAIKALVFGKKRELFQSNKSDEAARSSALAEVMTKAALEGFQLTPVFGVAAGYSPISSALQWLVTDPLSESTSAMLTGVEKAVGPYAKNATNVRKYEKSWDENIASVTAPTQMVYDMSAAMKLMVEYQLTTDAQTDRGGSLLNSSIYLASELIPGMRELRSYMKDVLKQSGYKDE